MSGFRTYKQIASVKMTKSTNLVISECSTGGYTVAKQVETIDEDGKVIKMFMKGAIHVPSKDKLKELADACLCIVDGWGSDDVSDERLDDIDWDAWH